MPDSLTSQVHDRLGNLIQPGDHVIDATAGNGHDTVFLANSVGGAGQVFAFDNQTTAINSTRLRLQQAGFLERVTLLPHGHEHMRQHIPVKLHGSIQGVVFNLGYLPGGDKRHMTRITSTLSALQQSYEILQPGGVISVIAYTGHAGGREETEAVKAWFGQLAGADCEITCPGGDNGKAPEWIWANKFKSTPMK